MQARASLASSAELVSDLLVQLEQHPLPVSVDLKLDRIFQFMNKIGNPESRLPPVIHVAGTNGKGSLIAYLRAICEAAGLRVHAYTSPHLVQFHERIVVAGEQIGDDLLADVLSQVVTASRDFPLTFFESTTAAAFLAFSKVPADIVLLETGLGGRLDATNLIAKPRLTAITPVSIDHAEFLGDSLAAIAGEKAGIIKQGTSCIIGAQESDALVVLKEKADASSAPVSVCGDAWRYMPRPEKDTFDYVSKRNPDGFKRLKPALEGTHQMHNAALAIACVEQLDEFAIDEDAIRKGLADVTWAARLQPIKSGALADKLAPLDDVSLWVDGGHNPAAGKVIAAWLSRREVQRPLHIVSAMVKAKDAEGFMAPLLPYAASIQLVEIPDEPMSKQADTFLEEIAALEPSCPVRATSFDDAMREFVAANVSSCDILCCGSLYFAGYVLAKNA